MIGTKFYKDNYKQEEYTQCANWCNTNSATIIDQGEYWEVVKLPEPTLEEVKQAKIDELKQARDDAEIQPIEYDDKLFDYDDKARERISIARQALEDGLTDTLNWTLADNTITEVNLATFKGINSTSAQRSAQLHAKYNTLKNKVEQATTTEEVQTINWEE